MAGVVGLVVATSILLLPAHAGAAVKSGVLKTGNSSTANFSIPVSKDFSTLYFWTKSPKTHIKLKVFSSNLNYDVDIKDCQADIWHIAYLYQPYTTSRNDSSLKAPSCTKFVNFAHDRVNMITMSSDKEVYWMTCSDIYSCLLQSPVPSTTQDSPSTGSYLVYLLIGSSALSLLLAAAVVALAFLLCRKRKANHLYEKAFWPPLPPPLPADRIPSGSNYLGGSREEAKTINQGTDNLGYTADMLDNPETPEVVTRSTTWCHVTEDPRASILDRESINSIYGIAIR